MYNGGLERVGPDRESAKSSKRHQASALWRLLFGRREIEGDSANPGKPA